MNKVKLLVLLITAGFVAGAAMAETIYRWVDKDGIVHFTQSPPTGLDYEVIKSTSHTPRGADKALEDLKAKDEAFEQRREERKKEARDAQLSTEERERKQKNCEQAKKNLELLKSKARFRLRDEQGKVTLKDETWRQEKIKEAEGQIQKFCN